MDRPNILLIMTDEQRWDTLGCYGNDVIETENLDWLASEGTVFTSAYSPSPSCVPARASLMTGMDPWNVGITGSGRGQGQIANLENTLPGVLSEYGYHTQGIGKMHFSPQRSLQGFHHTVLEEVNRAEPPANCTDYSRWFEENKGGDYGPYDHGIDNNSWMARPYHAPEHLHPNNWTINESIRFLQQRDPTKPFFLKVSFTRPHAPFDAVPYYFDYYMKQSLPKPSVGAWASIFDCPDAAMHPNAWHGRVSERKIHKARAGYYGQIHHIDHQIGRLFQYLRQQRLMEKTVILFISDHGNMMGDHHLWRKTYAYEGSAHIPFIVRLPKSMRTSYPSKAHQSMLQSNSDLSPSSMQLQFKVNASQSPSPLLRSRVDQPVCLQDVMPTLLDAAGVPIPKSVDGRSLLPLIRGEETEWREFVHGEHNGVYDEMLEMHYLTDGKWKYIWYARADREQLFHLEKDPMEMNDLAQDGRYAKGLAEWRQRLVGVLAPREAGYTEGNRLVCQQGKPPVLPPNAKYRKPVLFGNS